MSKKHSNDTQKYVDDMLLSGEAKPFYVKSETLQKKRPLKAIKVRKKDKEP